MCACIFNEHLKGGGEQMVKDVLSTPRKFCRIFEWAFIMLTWRAGVNSLMF